MDSIGLDLQTLINAGLLQVHAMCPMASGLGMHLASMDKLIDEYEPEVVIIVLIFNLINTSDALDARSILTQLIDYLKTKRITTVCTRLLGHDNLESQSTQRVPSLVDTWINLRFFGGDNERKLGISIVKSRGMSLQVRLRMPERRQKWWSTPGRPRGKRELERKLKPLNAQRALLSSEFVVEEDERKKLTSEEELRSEAQSPKMEKMARVMKADSY